MICLTAHAGKVSKLYQNYLMQHLQQKFPWIFKKSVNKLLKIQFKQKSSFTCLFTCILQRLLEAFKSLQMYINKQYILSLIFSRFSFNLLSVIIWTCFNPWTFLQNKTSLAKHRFHFQEGHLLEPNNNLL